MNMRPLGGVCAVAVLAWISAPATAGELVLSSLLGVPSGTATSDDNPPYMVHVSGYPVGVNCPGSW